MKFQANNIEYRSQDQLETLFLGNAEKRLALIISNLPGADGHYLEWNDQSQACYDGVEKIQLSGYELNIKLFPEAAKQLGEAEFQVELYCDETVFRDLVDCLKRIFQGKLLVEKAAPAKTSAPKQDYGKIRYLNLEGKKLRKLPEYVVEMTALEKAKLTYNPKLDLQDAFEVLADLPNLKELSFSTEGGMIPENLGKLSQLETLAIYDLTSPCTLPESIGQLKNLRSLLILSDSTLLLPESFADLTELESLNLRVTDWNLPSRFYQFSKLDTLDFSNGRISSFPMETAQMAAVTSVIFSNTDAGDFDQIMPLIAQMPNLKRLEMNMAGLPKSIGLCKQIEELVVWAGVDPDNPVQLPDELFDLTQLETLLLNLNYFEKIPAGIGRLKGLKTLVLQESVFESLPDSIGDLANLEFLNLSDNPALKSLPDSLGNLTKLKDLYLENLPLLTELPLSLKNLTNLEAVQLSDVERVKNVPEAWVGLME